MSNITRIAHVTDIHCNLLKNINIKDFFSKRFYGYLYWKFSKGKRFDPSGLKTIVSEINKECFDNIVITGDLTQLCLLEQFRNVKEFIFSFLSPKKLTIIPGNHDYYTFDGKRYYSEVFKDFSVLPYVKVINNVAIFCVDSSVVTPPFVSYGYVKKNQFEKLSKLLENVDKNLFKILLIHHPPIKGITSFSKCLLNSKKMSKLLSKGDFNLVLHGHTHHFNVAYFTLNSGKIPIVSAAPLCYRLKELDQAGGYNIYEISHNNEGWNVKLKRKIYDFENGLFNESEIEILS
jgi:3',5'-cyclic AMP phosphodiesterase CpdA